MLSVNWQRPPKAGGRKAQDCGRERACNLAPKAQPVAPGEERVIHSSRPPDRGKKRFWCLLGLRPKGTAARHPCVFVRKVIAPQPCAKVCLPMSRQHLFCRMPGSQPECLRHSRGKKSLAGQKAGRHFAAGRETGIFPAKSAFAPPVWSRQAKLPAGNFDAAAWGKQ